MGIYQAVDTAAKECLPTSGGGGRRSGRVIPGWNEYVKPFQDESLFWDGVWKAAGCPNIGELCNIRFNRQLCCRFTEYSLVNFLGNIVNFV